MKTVRLILLAALCLFGLFVKYASGPATNAPATTDAAVPEKALRVLNIVRTTGLPPEGYVGGRIFQNREGRLPSDGSYREFDVDPHEGGRNAERIIVEWNTKKAWYTGDHYQTFTPLP